jgi:hypothetical protein
MSGQKIKREHTIYPKCAKRTNGLFYKALITKDFVFYANYHEGDENANVEMYRRLGGDKLELVSNNYFASVGLHEALTEENWEYISQTMKVNYNHGKRSGYYEKESV